MENQNTKTYKSKNSVRNAVKKYTEELKTKDPEKYQDLLNYHRAYNKEYYRKLKEDRQKLIQIMKQMNN